MSQILLDGLTGNPKNLLRWQAERINAQRAVPTKDGKRSAVLPEKSPDEILAGFRKAWPGPGFADLLKDGSAIKVDSCSFPDRTSLGTCLVEREIEGASEQHVRWTLRHEHYGIRRTAESDAALKRCLRMEGKWDAPSVDDRNAARMRLRERAGYLGKFAE